MNTEKAIDLLDNLIGMVDDNQENDYDEAFRMAINALKAQADGDTISRKSAIDALRTCYDTETVTMDDGDEYINYGDAIGEIEQLPSAQPEKRTEKRTETHACDLISRKAAIDEIKALYEWHDTVTEDRTIDHLKRLPSAQPDSKELSPTHKSLDTVSRQAAIDAINQICPIDTEYDCTLLDRVDVRCVLTDLPSAQPDIIQCRNCKFASGDSRICMKFGHSPIGELDFCSWAERRTDD